MGTTIQTTSTPNLGAPVQAAVSSMLLHASAGQYAAMTVIASGTGYLEIRSGRAVPSRAPRKVPAVHPGPATDAAP